MRFFTGEKGWLVFLGGDCDLTAIDAIPRDKEPRKRKLPGLSKK